MHAIILVSTSYTTLYLIQFTMGSPSLKMQNFVLCKAGKFECGIWAVGVDSIIMEVCQYNYVEYNYVEQEEWTYKWQQKAFSQVSLLHCT